MGEERPRGRASWRQLASAPGLGAMVGSRTAQAFGRSFTPIALQVAAVRLGRGEPLVLSAILLASFVPAIVLGPFAGVLAERWNKRRTVAWAQVSRVAFVLLAAAAPSVPAFVATSLLLGISQAIYQPAYRALFPEVAGGDDLHLRATAMSQALEQVAAVVGTAVAAFAVVFVGIRPAFALDALVLAVSASLAFAVPRRFTGKAADGPGAGGVWRQLVEGFTAVGERRLARQLAGLMAAVTVGAVMMNPVLVLVPRKLLHAPVWWFGVFELVQAAAMALLGGLIASGLRLPRRTLVLGGFALCGVSVLGLALSRSIAADIALYVLFGLANMAFLAPVSAMYRLQFPLALRARGSAVYSSVVGVAQALGVVAGGVAAAALSVGAGLAIAGAWIVVATGAALVLGLLRDADQAPPAGPVAAAVT